MTVPTASLQSGDEIPVVGYGTGGLDGEDLRSAVHGTIQAGYTRFDTAEGYGNERALGAALGEYDRGDLFVQSKVLPRHLDYESVIESCKDSLARLNTDYLDLFLIHWPNPAISMRETMAGMATLHERGLVRNVGVSNFSAYQLSCAQHVSDVPIAVNQIECHLWRQQPEVREYCRETGVTVDAAAPVARTEVFEEETVQDLAGQYDRSPGQIALKWAIERDLTMIPRSTDPAHLRGNLDLFDWELSVADLQRLDDLDRDRSVYNLTATDWTDETYGIEP